MDGRRIQRFKLGNVGRTVRATGARTTGIYPVKRNGRGGWLVYRSNPLRGRGWLACHRTPLDLGATIGSNYANLLLLRVVVAVSLLYESRVEGKRGV